MRQTKAQMLEGTTGVRSAKIVGNNTLCINYENGDKAYRLHNTDVVTCKVNGDYVLNSGGWKTLTTKARINDYLPRGWLVSQRKHVWYLQQGWDTKEQFPFKDGITLKRTSEGWEVTGVGNEKKTLGIHKNIKKYVKGFVDALFNLEISQPSSGDCWYCLMRDKNSKTMGEFSHSDHITQHFKEKYYVPSLLVNAVNAYPVAPIVGNVLNELFEHKRDFTSIDGLAKKQISSSLTRYLKQQLGV